MLTSYFYNETIKRTVAVFGTLFNNIHVKIKNQDTGSTIREQKVPIEYASRDKLLARIEGPERDLDTAQRIAIQLPRMSFEIASWTYDNSTSISMLKKHNHTLNIDNMPFRQVRRSYSPSTYKITFQLNCYGKTQDDVLQIVEQIIPYFKPDFLVTITHSSVSDSVWDMPIVLNSISPNIQYTGDYKTRTTIIYSLDFECLVRFFGPISDFGVIQKVNANIKEIESEDNMEKIVIEAIPSSPSPNDQGFIINETVLDYADFGFYD